MSAQQIPVKEALDFEPFDYQIVETSKIIQE